MSVGGKAEAGPVRSLYRPEIDGLRAIAVVAVILVHARVRGFPGGFVGVDIFLVISGYLIAQLILRESGQGSFTLIGFYERRVRRILPALLTMLLASCVAGWMMLPVDFRQFGESVTAISLFASNLLFWKIDGYFRLVTDATPLLHTWSLAVEEQFYTVFPALLLLVRRTGRTGTRIALATGALASFLYSVWATHYHPAAAFYSPFSRAWEFLVGALLAAGAIAPPVRRIVGDTAAALGLALITYAILRLTEKSAFPGVHALLPVAGSFLVLFGTEAPTSRVSRALGARPLVAIGLISYSLYLWHWPLIVFGTYYAGESQGLVRIIMAVFAFPIGWLSWRYIERPFRKPQLLLSRRALFAGAVAASAILASYGILVWRADGFPGRVDPAVQRLSEPGSKPDYGCVSKPVSGLDADIRCRIGDKAAHPSFVLWGDSHAAVYFPALNSLARHYGVSGYDAAWFACPPLVSLTKHMAGADNLVRRLAKTRECDKHNDDVLGFIARERPQAVILAAEWSVYTSGKHSITEAVEGRPSFEDRVRALQRLGVRVYIVQDVPGTPLADARALAKALLLGDMRNVEPGFATYLHRDAAFRKTVAALQRAGLIELIEPAERLCGPAYCRVTDRGYPLYFDYDHLNARGAFFVAPVFEPMMRRLAQDQRAADGTADTSAQRRQPR
ncbi:MAG: acyltransferase family protein [Sphingomonas sp.]